MFQHSGPYHDQATGAGRQELEHYARTEGLEYPTLLGDLSALQAARRSRRAIVPAAAWIVAVIAFLLVRQGVILVPA